MSAFRDTVAFCFDAVGAPLNLLLPAQCPCCGSLVQRQGQLCAICFREIDFISTPICERCGVPLASATQPAGQFLCSACVASPPLYRRARAALRYNVPSRRLILPFKHADRTDLASVLAARMAHAGGALLCEADALIPVPLHRYRLFRRRYNQAALLADGLSRLTGIPAVLDALVRCRATAPLGEKSAVERAAAVRAAFSVRSARLSTIANGRLVLVDDVLTSGATANACARVLLAENVRSVDVLVVARVLDPRRS